MDSNVQQRLTIITLGVFDLQKSTSFYENMFGWNKETYSNDHISFFKLNGILFSLYPTKELAKDVGVSSEGSGFKQFTLAHNVHSEKEVDQLIENLKIKGVNIVKEPQKADWGGYSSYVSDLDGYLWEIAYNPYLALEKDGTIKK